jgi:hypothetical protein
MRQRNLAEWLDRAPRRSKSKPAQPRLPMQLQIGDRMTDSTGEWEVAGRPFTTAGGKNAQVRLQRVDKPGVKRSALGERTRKSA